MQNEIKDQLVYIFDPQKNEFVDKTFEILKYWPTENTKGETTHNITFKNNESTTYSYNNNEKIKIEEPEKIFDIQSYTILNKYGKAFKDIKEIWEYSSKIKIISNNKEDRWYEKSEISLLRTYNNDSKIKATLDYLKEVETLLMNSKNKNNDNNDNEEKNGFLINQLNKILVTNESFLYKYIRNDINSNENKNKNIKFFIHPFGTNKSQMVAVENVFKSDLSIIQGPPGTGKTNTILNIITNILLNNKSVAVASNNNTAVKNIEEKLKEAGQNFFIANLGNNNNISKFFNYDIKHKNELANKYEHNNILENDNNIVETRKLLLNELKTFKQKNNIKEKLSKLNLKEQLLKCYEILLKKIWDIEIKIPKLVKDIEDFQIEWEHKKQYLKNIELINKINFQKLDSVTQNTETILEMISVIENGHLNNKQSVKKQRNILKNKNKRFYNFGNKFLFWRKFKIFNLRKHINNIEQALVFLENKYYKTKIQELKKELEELKIKLNKNKFDNIKECYVTESKDKFSKFLLEHCKQNSEIEFKEDNYKEKWGEFIKKFPVILSTTNSLMKSTKDEYLYDYLIIDEASQVSLTTAFLAFSKAKNVVLVGDLKQLQHVVEADKSQLINIFEKYDLNWNYEYYDNSILRSAFNIYGKQINTVLLNEHYRCDPQIIDFCNKRFYNNQLIIRTKHKPLNGIFIEKTKGKFEFNKQNDREYLNIDKIAKDYNLNKDVGIISPYSNQVVKINGKVVNDEIEVGTIHKFQGKEKKTIFLSLVKDELTIFLNNENLMNVAISRAKDKLYIVANGEIFKQKNSIMYDLEKYFEYKNIKNQIQEARIYSVFDLMYKNYHSKLKQLGSRLLSFSEFQTENIFGSILEDVLREEEFKNIKYYFNHPLKKVINITTIKNEKDLKFINNPNTHCDFILYNDIYKKYIVTFEIDGLTHLEEKQIKRDQRKDKLILKSNLKTVRIPIYQPNNYLPGELEDKIRKAIRDEFNKVC